MASNASDPFSQLVIANIEGSAHGIRHRQNELLRLQKALIDAKQDFLNAIKDDNGHSDFEATFEYCSMLSELREHYDSINIEIEVRKSRSLELGIDNLERSVGFGIVYIVPITHTLLYSVVSPLSAAIAAGNCVIVEIPQTTSRVSSLLRNVLINSLNADTFAIAKSRPNADFMKQCIMLTDSGPTELPCEQQHHVVSASKRLTFAIIDRTADVALTAQSLVSARFGFGGSSPYAPDLVMVHEAVKDKVLEQLVSLLRKVSPDSKRKPANKYAFEKKESEKSDSTEDVITIVSYSRNKIVEITKDNFATLIKKSNKPVLTLYSVTSMDHAIDRANQYGTLSAAYIFANLESSSYLANFIKAHVTCVNQIPTELLVGPFAPLHFQPRLTPRYTIAMFQEARPQLVSKSAITQIAGVPNAAATAKFKKWVQDAETPLRPTGQLVGNKTGFFEQALMIGMTASLLTITGSLALVGTAVWRYRR